MSYPKNKVEKYSNVGGINQKASAYVTGDNEVMDLENYDFQKPGAWSKRFGFTAAYAPSASFTIGASETINAIWQISTPATFTDNNPGSVATKNIIGFDSGIAFSSGYAIQGSTMIKTVSGQTLSIWDHSEYQDGTYYSNGTESFKSTANGTTSAIFGMATPHRIFAGNPSGLTVTATTAGTTLSGTFVYQYAYLDYLGFVGAPGASFVYSTAGANSITISGFTTTGYGLTSALAYGATAYVIFKNRVPGFPTTDMISIGTIPIGATTFIDTGVYTDTNSYSAYDFDSLGALDYTKQWNVSEIYQNRLWRDSGLNQIQFSELEDPENFLPESNLTIAANNFRLTGMANYNQSLIIFCQKGIFRLTGDNPDNFNIQNASNEYGCISDKAVVEFNEKLWFLDYQQIVEFNGANFDSISNRVENYLSRVNKEKVYRRACAVHLQERDEVWFSIPIDGSEVNNITLVYNYLVDGWTTFRGTKFKATAFGTLYTGTSNGYAFLSPVKNYYFGSIGASMYVFGESFKNDDSTGITTSFTTRYHNELGKSQTAQFRRFYLDYGGYSGPSLVFGLNFYANYSTQTISLTRSMSITNFEDRIDFGIPAKSLSVQVSHGSTMGDLVINGYTVEFRYQRSV